MADADVPITAGTGTKIDTRTVGAGTDEHRQVVVIGDPTTASSTAAVKAASTAPVAADPALVVALSPNTQTIVLGAGAATVGTVLNVGDVDHDAVNTGKVVQTGGHASFPAIPTAVSADGDRVRQWQDRTGAQIVRKRPVATYTAVYRLANSNAGSRVLGSGALTANTNKQIATIYHTASSTKRVQVKYVAVTLFSVASVAGIIEFEIQTLSATTAPATGNPAITPGKSDQADSAAEAACLALPGTQGSVVSADQPVGDTYIVNLGISGTGSTVSPPAFVDRTVLWDSREMDDGKDLIMRAGVAEGYTVLVRSSAASNVLFTVTMIFTEE